MFAVIRTGGKQYRVAPNDIIKIERVAGEPGDIIELGEVLLLGGDSPKTGSPLIAGALVAAEVMEQTRGDKIVVFKKKRRKNYRRKKGHRQDLTLLRITEILTDGKKPSQTKVARPEPKKVEAKKAEAERPRRNRRRSPPRRRRRPRRRPRPPRSLRRRRSGQETCGQDGSQEARREAREEEVRTDTMAHKKAGGSSRNGRNSAGRRLGVKKSGGQRVIPGNIIIRQRGTKWHPGDGVGMGVDHTLFAVREGEVEFATKRKGRVYVSVKPN